MADGIVQLPVDGAGKKLDTEQLTVGANTVQRERMQIAGDAATEIAEVAATDPSALDFGLVVREAPPDSIQVDYDSSSDLAQGASADLDSSTIAAASTGKLMQVTVASSVPCKWVIKTRDDAVEVIKGVIFTGGLADTPSFTWKPVSKEGVTLAGDGVDENFRVTATNLSGAAVAADVHATFEWDEV